MIKLKRNQIAPLAAIVLTGALTSCSREVTNWEGTTSHGYTRVVTVDQRLMRFDDDNYISVTNGDSTWTLYTHEGMFNGLYDVLTISKPDGITQIGPNSYSAPTGTISNPDNIGITSLEENVLKLCNRVLKDAQYTREAIFKEISDGLMSEFPRSEIELEETGR